MSAPFVVGLTGGIGSGKSAVAAAFAASGIDVTDADRLAHELSVPGVAGYLAIVAEFGQGVRQPDGTLDRAVLRKRVFADAAARTTLAGLMHPLIGDAAIQEVNRWRSVYGILMVPLLVERDGLRKLVHRILVVDCPEETQVQRGMQRSGLAPEAARAIMTTQASRAQRLAAANDILDNCGSPEAIIPQVKALDRRYRALAAEHAAGARR